LVLCQFGAALALLTSESTSATAAFTATSRRQSAIGILLCNELDGIYEAHLLPSLFYKLILPNKIEDIPTGSTGKALVQPPLVVNMHRWVIIVVKWT
jgi:hypothetical protein